MSNERAILKSVALKSVALELVAWNMHVRTGQPFKKQEPARRSVAYCVGVDLYHDGFFPDVPPVGGIATDRQALVNEAIKYLPIETG